MLNHANLGAERLNNPPHLGAHKFRTPLSAMSEKRRASCLATQEHASVEGFSVRISSGDIPEPKLRPDAHPVLSGHLRVRFDRGLFKGG